jgi:hypothetical protein
MVRLLSFKKGQRKEKSHLIPSKPDLPVPLDRPASLAPPDPPVRLKPGGLAHDERTPHQSRRSNATKKSPASPGKTWL